MIDASFNRATEGLRVIEDFVRFVLDDGLLTRLAKEARHDLVSLISGQTPLFAPGREQALIETRAKRSSHEKTWPGKEPDGLWVAIDLHGARETGRDVGTQISTGAETCRNTPADVCAASFQRVKQAIRSLEEFGKLTTPLRSAALETLRYRVYTLERCVTLAAVSRERLATSRLCVLIDGCENQQAFLTLIGELTTAGVGMIQLRDKQLGDAILAARARLLVERTRPSPEGMALNGGQPQDQNGRNGGQTQNGNQTLAIINDRPDLAAVVHADGVHLGQEDLSVKDARMIVGPRALVGVSIHSIDQARTAVLDGANYLGVGPTFPSPTKDFATYPGLELLRQVADEIGLAAYAIGGIQAENLLGVLATGIEHIAVSSAVTRAPEPGAAAGRLLKILAEKSTDSE